MKLIQTKMETKRVVNYKYEVELTQEEYDWLLAHPNFAKENLTITYSPLTTTFSCISDGVLNPNISYNNTISNKSTVK
jgi:HSP20 family molecular chaperone IbpA